MKKILSLVLMMLLVLAPMAIAEDFDPADYPVAIAMDSMNHPVHRIVQLGFLKAAEALGYTDAQVIGTEGGDASEVFAAAEAFAAEGGAGLLLWAGDSGCYETVASVGSQGVTVGIPTSTTLRKTAPIPKVWLSTWLATRFSTASRLLS